ncbi:MAG: YitT family protein [Phytoplasma sp.]|uniref:YitT family protein n=1 Tax=Phytoplasma sp. TaxID=2155 RepID=UPI002B417949|nr:YitT family protein [Phytoplasma sp.]WRH06793.1 MAG: YitT family protein [Phytoplasma sp.]
MKNEINYNKNFKRSFYKWSILIINDIILAFAIYFFIIGPKLNNGGLDGLSLLTIQIINFFSSTNLSGQIFDLWIFIFVFLFNLLAIYLGYKLFGKDFCQKTLFLAFFLTFCFFLLNHYIGYDNNQKILLQFQSLIPINEFIFVIYSILGGLFIGYTLSNIRNLGYNTGGMDILQKILKDIYGINFIIALLLTDGIIIFASSLIEGKNSNSFFIRLFCSVLSVIIVGFIMEKRDFLNQKSKIKKFIKTNNF